MNFFWCLLPTYLMELRICSLTFRYIHAQQIFPVIFIDFQNIIDGAWTAKTLELIVTAQVLFHPIAYFPCTKSIQIDYLFRHTLCQHSLTFLDKLRIEGNKWKSGPVSASCHCDGYQLDGTIPLKLNRHSSHLQKPH